MNPLFETQVPGRRGQTLHVGDQAVHIAATSEAGLAIVAAPLELGLANQWLRRLDIEHARSQHYEQLGAQLAADMRQADAAGSAFLAEEAARAAAAVVATATVTPERAVDSTPVVDPTPIVETPTEKKSEPKGKKK